MWPHQAPRDLKGLKGLLEVKALLDNKGLKAPLDNKGLKGLLEVKAPLDLKGLKDLKGRLEVKAPLDSKGLKGLLEVKAPLDLKATQAFRAVKGCRVHRQLSQAPPELLDQLARFQGL